MENLVGFDRYNGVDTLTVPELEPDTKDDVYKSAIAHNIEPHKCGDHHLYYYYPQRAGRNSCNRLGRFNKIMFVSTESTSSYEFASQFSLAILYTRKTPTHWRKPYRPRECLFE